jgi:hypothetical protein
MDIKRKLSPHLGDDLRIRIFFGETQSVIVSSSSPPGSLSPLPKIKSKSSGMSSSREAKEVNESRGVELVATNRANGSNYQGVLREEEL